MIHEIVNTENHTSAAHFVEHFALLLDGAGMPRMPARVFAAVLAEDSELTARGLAVRLGVSPAAISGAVRYLTQAGMLSRGREPGARVDDYRISDDVWYETYAHRGEMLARREERWTTAPTPWAATRRPAGGSRRRASSSPSCARSCRR